MQSSKKSKTVFAAVVISAVLALAAWLILRGGSHTGSGYHDQELKLSGAAKTGFTLLAPDETGIGFKNDLGDEYTTANQLLDIGSGVAVGDVDGDGLPDIFFCSLDAPNKLYKNLGGWKFQDITGESGINAPAHLSRGAVFADIDGDGDLDLLITTFLGMKCFLNDGRGKFTDRTDASGLLKTQAATTMALADVDGDGDLDLYVAHYRRDTLRDGGNAPVKMVNGQVEILPEGQDRITIVDGAMKEYGEADTLYLNNGKGMFAPVSWTGGAFLDADGNRLNKPPLDWGLTATFRDMNNDGAPDIYVCNDFWTPDRIWINDGKGRFREIEKTALRKTSASSMGVDFADINRDGFMDFFVVDMLSPDYQTSKMQMPALKAVASKIGETDNRPQVTRNTLFLNQGDNSYAEIAYLSGVQATDWSWSPVFLDVDLDGYEDLLITNGHLRDVQDADTQKRLAAQTGGTLEEQRQRLLLYPRLDTPNMAFRNLGNLQFQEVAHEWGVDAKGISHGIALADFDGDGDLDFVANNFGAVAGVYRNDTQAPRVAVRLQGEAANLQGIGAKVKLTGGAVAEQMQEMTSGGRYLSGSDPELVFAAGDAKNDLTLEVNWRSGKVSRIDGVRANRLYIIEEAGAETAKPKAPPVAAPMFEDASKLLRHRHQENEFDDFQRQPLLPYRLSQLGPGVAWFDLNHTGYDDLLIGGGKDGRLSVYLNDGKGGFAPANATGAATPRDETAVLAWSEPDGAASVLVGLANYEDGQAGGDAATIYNFQNGALTAAQSLPADAASAGALALADTDGDGDLDVFMGGRVLPGRYPQAASSKLYRNEGGKFVLDGANSARFASIGLVTGAVFSDVNNDGFADLIMALEGNSLKVFLNEKGSFVDATEQLGLSKYKGLWNSVTVGDFDEDGRMDIVAANRGLNSRYHLDAAHPYRIFYDDFDGNGVLDIVEAHFEAKLGKYVPERRLDALQQALPSLQTKFASYRDFGAAGIAEIFGAKIDSAPTLELNTLEHAIFFNRGDHFEMAALPIEAQFAPGFGLNVADFDGDGHEDLFLAQNFFALQADAETARYDGGCGLLMKGDGKGGLVAVKSSLSGLKIYGDARGSAAGDFDRDGRVDLVVAENGAATRLFRNTAAKPGLRIRLVGATPNVNAIGATIRLMYGTRAGAARELHAGSGYWSQDSLTQVMGTPEAPTKIQVRWAGGKITTADIPAGAQEIQVDAEGKVTVGK